MLPRDAAWKAYVDQWLREKMGTPTKQALRNKSRSISISINGCSIPAAQRCVHISFDHLRDLMLQRLSLMEDVAAYKWNQGFAD